MGFHRFNGDISGLTDEEAQTVAALDASATARSSVRRFVNSLRSSTVVRLPHPVKPSVVLQLRQVFDPRERLFCATESSRAEIVDLLEVRDAEGK